MDDLEKGTWIINSAKHLVNVKSTAPELGNFEATELAGKIGMFLSRLVADQEEIVPSAKVAIFRRESGISRGEVQTCFDLLKEQGKIDFTNYDKDVEVYCFSAQDAITSSSRIHSTLNPSPYDQANLLSLKDTFQFPRFKEEILESLTSKGISEKVAKTTLNLQDTLELVRTSKVTDETIYYNEYAFADDPKKIVKALKSITPDDRSTIEEIQATVSEIPGFLYEKLEKEYPSHLLKLMEGIGLIDALPVYSDFGNATFVTIPQLKGIAIGNSSPLSIDVFHKAKILLSCLRFGEYKSQSWRGKIASQEKMYNIVNKLVRGDWVGPCTAIGQDYQLLEKDGVIITRPDKSGMYFMQLRQREVGLIVQQMLAFKRVAPEADMELQKLLEKQPLGYDLPEHRRSEILAKPVRPVLEIREQMLQSLRTGMR